MRPTVFLRLRLRLSLQNTAELQPRFSHSAWCKDWGGVDHTECNHQGLNNQIIETALKLTSVMVRLSVAIGSVACCVTIIELPRSSVLHMVSCCSAVPLRAETECWRQTGCYRRSHSCNLSMISSARRVEVCFKSRQMDRLNILIMQKSLSDCCPPAGCTYAAVPQHVHLQSSRHVEASEKSPRNQRFLKLEKLHVRQMMAADAREKLDSDLSIPTSTDFIAATYRHLGFKVQKDFLPSLSFALTLSSS
jgi:hypothetical protein